MLILKRLFLNGIFPSLRFNFRPTQTQGALHCPYLPTYLHAYIVLYKHSYTHVQNHTHTHTKCVMDHQHAIIHAYVKNPQVQHSAYDICACMLDPPYSVCMHTCKHKQEQHHYNHKHDQMSMYLHMYIYIVGLLFRIWWKQNSFLAKTDLESPLHAALKVMQFWCRFQYHFLLHYQRALAKSTKTNLLISSNFQHQTKHSSVHSDSATHMCMHVRMWVCVYKRIYAIVPCM